MYALVDGFSFGAMRASFMKMLVNVMQVVVWMQMVVRVQVVVVMVMVWVLLIMMWRKNEFRRGFFDASFEMFFQSVFQFFCAFVVFMFFVVVFCVVAVVFVMFGWCSASIFSETSMEFRFESFDFGFYLVMGFLVTSFFTGMEFFELGRAV